jgi:hypothetical protein
MDMFVENLGIGRRFKSSSDVNEFPLTLKRGTKPPEKVRMSDTVQTILSSVSLSRVDKLKRSRSSFNPIDPTFTLVSAGHRKAINSRLPAK